MRTRAAAVMVACLATSFAASQALAEQPAAPAGATAASADQPFPPSWITTSTGQNTKVEDFQDPAICAGCHPRQAAGWNGSMHSIAFVDPVLQNLWALGDKETNGATLNHCGACHTAIGISSGTVRFDPSKPVHGAFEAPGVAAKGVSCDTCHTISASNMLKTKVLEHGNSSFELSPGPVKRGPLKDSKSPFHGTAYSELHGKADFCGSCHNIFHPENLFPVERTYDEWKYSVYAQNGIPCQDCHMVPVATAVKVADTLTRAKDLGDKALGGAAGLGGPMDRDLVHDHGFVGGNAVIAPLLGVQGGEEHKAMAIERLQTVAGLDVKVKKQDGPLHKLYIKVMNKRAGHHLPTSLTEVRQVWVETVVTDDKGRELLRSGTLTAENEVPEDAVIFNSHAADKNDKDTVKPWEVVRFVDVNTIPPKGYKYAKYAFNLPEDAKSVKVVAKLHYRSFSQGLADLLVGKDKVKVPSVEMVALEKTIDLPMKVAELDPDWADAD
jgi:hypothetical protein